MHHPGAEDLNPPGAAADPAPRTTTNVARHLRFAARFGKREETASNSDFSFTSEQGSREILEHAAQIGHGYTCVHRQTLDLVEDRFVAGIHILVSIAATHGQYSNRRPDLFHDPYLSG